VTVKEYFLPESLDEAVKLRAKHGPAMMVMAGGTIAVSLVNQGLVFPQQVMGLRRARLNQISRSNGILSLGATTTLSQLVNLEAVPLLQEAARHTAGWSVRNMGTVGGNLFARFPYGDMGVALLALEAQAKLVSPAGMRLVPLTEFYTGPHANVVAADELLAGLHLPMPQGQTIYLKFGRKQFNTPAVVTVAAQLSLNEGRVTAARLALGAAGPYPFRSAQAEAALIGGPLNPETIAAAAAAAMADSQPITDAVASAAYRQRMVGVMVRRALTQLAEQER